MKLCLLSWVLVSTIVSMRAMELGDEREQRNQLINAILNSDETGVILALTQDIDINVPGKKYGRDDPPLCVAAANGCSAIVALMVANGAEPDITDANGDTPIHNAVRFGHFASAQSLYNGAASLHIKNIWGQTALHEALDVASPQYNIIEWLLRKGVAVNEPDDEGNTAGHLAFAKNRNDIVDLLDEYEADWDAQNEDGLKPEDMKPFEFPVPDSPPPPIPEQYTISYANLDDLLGYFYPRTTSDIHEDTRDEFDGTSQEDEPTNHEFVNSHTFFAHLFDDARASDDEQDSSGGKESSNGQDTGDGQDSGDDGFTNL